MRSANNSRTATGLLGLFGVYCLHGAIEAAQKLRHRVVKRLILELRDRPQELRHRLIMGQCHTQNSKEVEEIAVPCKRPIITVAVVLAVTARWRRMSSA